MYFRGFKDRYSSVYRIKALIQNINIDSTIINFVIDTGSTQTIIGVKDAIKLKLLSIKEETLELINNYNLPLEKTQTAIGSMSLLKLDNIILTFHLNELCFFAEHFEAIYISNPVIKNEEEYKVIKDIPSVLGINVLKNYKIEFSNDIVLLER
ncbi:MAG: hypothetical protein M3Z01_03765 [Thermoproteota archaeon]|nr:hypothetical protein [Thermoproteota archaeon]